MTEQQPVGHNSIGINDDEQQHSDSYSNVDSRVVQIEQALSSLGKTIAQQAQQAEADRRWIEELWVADVRQFRGLPAPNSKITKKEVRNITRSRTRTASARLGDLLFQSGDKNFTVKSGGNELLQPAQQQLHPLQPEEKKPEKLIEDKITSILEDADYESVGRKAIEDACLLGVGVVQAPIMVQTKCKQWSQDISETGEPVNTLSVQREQTLSVKSFSIWDYYPDLSVAEHKDCAFEFRRHFFTKIQLEQLLKEDGYRKSAILRVLTSEKSSMDSTPWWRNALQGDNVPSDPTQLYVIWEGHLSLDGQLLAELHQQIMQTDHDNSWCGIDEQDCSRASEHNKDVEIVIWVSSDGEIIKIAPTVLETNERPFSVFCYDRDAYCFLASPGIPRLMQNDQEDITKFWSMTSRNAGLATGPQWVFNPNVIEPVPDAEGKLSYAMTPNKGWRLKRPVSRLDEAFYFFNVPNNIEATVGLKSIAKGHADESAMIPEIAQGQQSHEMTKTVGGMEILMQSANTVARRIVKDWLDNVTIPLIGRLIDAVMTFCPVQGVHGQFTAVVRGANALMMKHTQAQNAVSLAQIAMTNPEFAQRTDWGALYKQVLYGLQQEPESVLLSAEELLEIQQIAQQQPAEEDPLLLLEQDKLAVAREKIAMDKYIAHLRFGVEREKAQTASATKLKEVKTKAGIEERKILLQAKTREHLMAQEYKVESTGESRL